MARTVSILIVDDHESIRQLLKDRLSAEPDMTVVSHVDNAEAAVIEAIEHKPDVILMDIDMPGLSAFDAAARITARCPNSRVLFLTAFVKDRYIESALAVQAWGYVTKTEPPEAVIKAIRDVSRGFAYFSREVQSRLVVDSKGVRLAERGQTLASTLTPREREVLCYLAQGRSK
ncbi:MAG: response regulator, partial [Phycisphaerae bacterium]